MKGWLFESVDNVEFSRYNLVVLAEDEDAAWNHLADYLEQTLLDTLGHFNLTPLPQAGVIRVEHY